MRKSTVALVCAVFAAFAGGFYVSRATIVPEPLPSSRVTYWRVTDSQTKTPVDYVLGLSNVPKLVKFSLYRFDPSSANEMEFLWSIDMERHVAHIRYETDSNGASLIVQTPQGGKQIPIKEGRLDFFPSGGVDLRFKDEKVAMAFGAHPNPTEELHKKLYFPKEMAIHSPRTLVEWAKRDGVTYYAFIVKKLADK